MRKAPPVKPKELFFVISCHANTAAMINAMMKNKTESLKEQYPDYDYIKVNSTWEGPDGTTNFELQFLLKQ